MNISPFSQSSRSNSAVHWEKPQDNRTFSVERECHLQMTKILVICEKIALIAIGSTRRVGHVTCKESDWKSQLTIGRQQSNYREVPRWEIFMEQDLRFGLDLGRVALLKKKHLGRFFQVFVGKKRGKAKNIEPPH